MWSLFCLTIICFVLSARALNNTSNGNSTVVGLKFRESIVGTNVTNANGTAVADTKRRVLILNSQRLDSALRQFKGRGKPKKQGQPVQSLLYVEYDDNGKIINTHPMFKLEDVVVFFKVFLATDIRVCEIQCDDEDP